VAASVKSKLYPFQLEAVERWIRGDSQGPYRGTLEVFTGGGKTLIALACFEHAASRSPGLRLAVVVPTEALAHQWVESIVEHTGLEREEVGVLGAGGHGSLGKDRALVAVINTAAKSLPEMAREIGDPLILVVDECHRAGAPTFSRVLTTPAEYTLGLSATPDREEVDENGDPIEYDEHLLGQRLGEVVFRFGLNQAMAGGWLPAYEIHHHGVELHPGERRRYDKLTREVDDAADQLRDLGVLTSQARRVARRSDESGAAARAYVAATSRRKDLLYRGNERERVTMRVVRDLHERPSGPPRILLFHERVKEAADLFRALRRNHPDLAVALEHSRLAPQVRAQALDGFRAGQINVLVSVKSLIEGIDVPGADVGISVASTASVRQRIQALGRVLRRGDSAVPKEAEMHLLYVADTADELIYGREDWSDLTGPERNHYWRWSLDPAAPPQAEIGPPLRPRPTEEQEWKRLGERLPADPVPWLGALPDREYSVDSRGTVTTPNGAIVANPQAVGEMLQAVRSRPGGRFWVTPAHRLVLVRGDPSQNGGIYVVGRLAEPFGLRSTGSGAEAGEQPRDLVPGSPFNRPLTKEHGSFHLGQKLGGVIERRRGRVREFALTDDAEDHELGENARRVLAAWRQVSDKGFPFFVNDRWDAWYVEAGEPRFLASVPGGFEWPQAPEEA
jgi:superfamily II DNA or RNA helicase